MQELTVRVSAGKDGKTLGITLRGGPFSLHTILKGLTEWRALLAAIEREMTGQARARIDWQIVEWTLIDVPDAAPEGSDHAGDAATS